MRDDLTGAYANDERFHHETYTPWLIENANLPKFVVGSTHMPGWPERPMTYPEIVVPDDFDNRELLRNPVFQNMLIGKLDRINDIYQRIGPFDVQLENVTSALEAELGTAGGK